MLQQTQVPRVTLKYHQFIERFPNLQALAAAPLKEVLTVWQGLGYNRRALYLHEAAQVLSNYQGEWQVSDLVHLKGIGANTAAAVCVYAYNQPHIFIETNIRTVFIHHFFADQQVVSDAQLLPFIQATLDVKNPRQWYWALMDYGSHLKTVHKNPGTRAAAYKKQSTFEGSLRQLRAQILRSILSEPKNLPELQALFTDTRLQTALRTLEKDGLIVKTDAYYQVI